jgi:hypothetical protein
LKYEDEACTKPVKELSYLWTNKLRYDKLVFGNELKSSINYTIMPPAPSFGKVVILAPLNDSLEIRENC